VYASGEVAVVSRMNLISFLNKNSGNKFGVEWADPPAGETSPFPLFTQNCTRGCQPLPERGGA
jgi:hypothetical protein